MINPFEHDKFVPQSTSEQEERICDEHLIKCFRETYPNDPVPNISALSHLIKRRGADPLAGDKSVFRIAKRRSQGQFSCLLLELERENAMFRSIRLPLPSLDLPIQLFFPSVIRRIQV